MLVLAVADFNATREMGPILALGIAVMVVAGLTLLPAILGTLGRRAFWPAVPPRGGEPAAGVGDVDPRRPRWSTGAPAATAAAVTLVLLAGTLGNLGGREALDFSEAFRTPPESVGGEELISERFIPGRAAPDRRRDGLRGPRDRDLAPDRWPHDTGPGDVSVRRLGPDAGRGIASWRWRRPT